MPGCSADTTTPRSTTETASTETASTETASTETLPADGPPTAPTAPTSTSSGNPPTNRRWLAPAQEPEGQRVIGSDEPEDARRRGEEGGDEQDHRNGDLGTGAPLGVGVGPPHAPGTAEQEPAQDQQDGAEVHGTTARPWWTGRR